MPGLNALPHRRPQRGMVAAHQRGAAALAVVMVLFLIISLVAAYASRRRAACRASTESDIQSALPSRQRRML